jgi:hypothetical protein
MEWTRGLAAIERRRTAIDRVHAISAGGPTEFDRGHSAMLDLHVPSNPGRASPEQGHATVDEGRTDVEGRRTAIAPGRASFAEGGTYPVPGRAASREKRDAFLHLLTAQVEGGQVIAGGRTG